jgi:hypothetical protein
MFNFGIASGAFDSDRGWADSFWFDCGCKVMRDGEYQWNAHECHYHRNHLAQGALYIGED